MTTTTVHHARTTAEHPLAQARIRALAARPVSPLRVVHTVTPHRDGR